MKIFKPAAGIISLLILFACHNSSHGDNKSQLAVNDLAKPEFKHEGDKQATDSTTTGNQQPNQFQTEKKQESPTIDWDKKIIKTAELNLETKNYKSFNAFTRLNVKKYGGYISQERQNQNDYKIETVATIKVPVDQFDNLMAELTSGDQQILEKKINSEDVTTQIIDTRSRMEAKKQVRLRYLDLLKQAKNIEEILNVQKEVNAIQEDIEAATGRIGYLTHSAAYSTINLTYFQVVNASAKDYNDPSFGTKVWLSFKNGWNWIGDVFVGIISIWPLFLLGFICWMVYKRWRASKIQKPVA